jgi:hypothetical protein
VKASKIFLESNGGYKIVDKINEDIDRMFAVREPDMVNRPPHYTTGSREVIDEMRELAGTDEEFCTHLHLTAFKYIKRASKKGNYAQDMAKAAWYCNMAAHVSEPEKYPDPRTK